MATRAWPSGDAPERPQSAGAEAVRHLFLGWVGVAQAGRHREVDERIDGQGHHQHGPPVPGHGRAERGPTETHDEVRNGERHHQQHCPDPAARKVGALDQPCRARPEHRAERRHHDREPHGVPEQMERQGTIDERCHRVHACALRLDQQEGKGQQQNQGYQQADEEEPGGAGSSSSTPGVELPGRGDLRGRQGHNNPA